MLYTHTMIDNSQGAAGVGAAYDDVAAQDGAVVHVVVDRAGDDRGGHRELDRRGVDDAHDVARAGGLEHAEEGPVAAVLSVQLDDLLVVVGALEQLDARVERAAVSLEEDLHAVDRRVERVRAEGATLDGGGGLHAVGRGHVHDVGDDVGGDRELDLADVADGDGVGATGGLDDGGEGAELAVLDVHAHLARRVVGAVPELNVSIEGTALGAEHDLHLLDRGRAVRPGAERAALHQDGRVDALVVAALGRDDTTGEAGGANAHALHLADLHGHGRARHNGLGRGSSLEGQRRGQHRECHGFQK